MSCGGCVSGTAFCSVALEGGAAQLFQVEVWLRKQRLMYVATSELCGTLRDSMHNMHGRGMKVETKGEQNRKMLDTIS